MNIFSLLSVFCAIIYLEFGIYVIAQNRNSVVNRWFLTLCISFFIWSVAYIFCYSAPNETSVIFWDKVASIGWISFPALMIKFFAVASRQEDKIPFLKTVIIIHYVAAVVFFIINIYDSLLSESFYKQNELWFFNPRKNFLPYWLFYGYIVSATVFTLVILFIWRRNLSSNREKKQFFIVLISVLFFVGWGYITDILFPMLQLPLLPNMAHISSLIWVGGVGYAILKYKMLHLNPDLASNLIIEKLKEIFFFVSIRGKIINSNKYTELITGYRNDDLKNTPLFSLFHEKEFVKTLIQRIALDKSNESFELTLISKSGEHIPIIISYSLVKDPYNDTRGFIVYGHDNREALRLKNEIAVRQQAAAHLQRIKEELEKRVKSRNEDLIKSYKELQIKITERREVEDLIKADIAEKEIIIDEINNRVKNNMSLIITMIEALSANETNPVVQLKYDELSQRVKAILLIQKNLYLSLSYAEVDFGNFLMNLTDSLLDFYQARDKVTVDYKVTGDFLNIDYSVPCGIVANELISNALKHAFPQQTDTNKSAKSTKKNILFIGYEAINQDYTLSISDNGQGLNEDFDIKDADSIGLQLVDILVNDQISGSLEILKTRGTSFIIRFSTKKHE